MELEHELQIKEMELEQKRLDLEIKKIENGISKQNFDNGSEKTLQMSKVFRVSAKGIRTNGKYFEKACVELYLNYRVLYLKVVELL